MIARRLRRLASSALEATAPGAQCWRAPDWRHLSVRTRLTIWYVALLAGTLIGLITLGLWLARASCTGNADEVLARRPRPSRPRWTSPRARCRSVRRREEGRATAGRRGAGRGSSSGSQPTMLVYRYPPGSQLGQRAGRTSRRHWPASSSSRPCRPTTAHCCACSSSRSWIGRGHLAPSRSSARRQTWTSCSRMRQLGLAGVVLGLVVAWAGGSFLASRAAAGRSDPTGRRAHRRRGSLDAARSRPPPTMSFGRLARRSTT